MPCCVPDLLHTLPLSLAKEYNSDLGVDHWTAVKIILKRTKELFLGYGGDKRVRRKELHRCKFYTNPNDSESQSRYILKVGAIS